MAQFSDDFDRAEADALGADWDETNTSTAATLKTKDNGLMCNSSSVPAQKGYAIWNNGAFAGDDVFSQLEWAANPAGSGYSGPGVRMSGTQTTFTGYVAIYDVVNTRIRLMEYNGVNMTSALGTQLGVHNSYTPTAADLIRIEADGDQITVKLNGAIIIGPVTDATIASGGNGFATCQRASGTQQTRWEAWIGGDIVVLSGTGNTRRIWLPGAGQGVTPVIGNI
jgi:hypothetical protein